MAFNEPFLRQTILSAVENSSSPDRIFFGVVEQRTDGIFSELQDIKNVRHKRLEVSAPLGVGLPRSYSMDLLKDEDYCLITDSHMIFNHNWDENIIRRIKYLEKDFGNKIIISQHLPTLDIDENNLVLYPEKRKDTPCYLKFDGIFIDDIPIPSGTDFFQQYPVTCHYMFSFSQTFKDIKFDPRIFYFAEESSLSMRFSTRGYKVFSTRYFPMFHLQKTNSYKIKSWQDLEGTERLQDDIEIVYKIFSGKEIGEWSASSLVDLKEFLNNSGLDISYYMSGIDTSRGDNFTIYQIRHKIVDIFENNKTFYENLYDRFIPEIRYKK